EPESHHEPQPSRYPRLKVLYLLAISAATFAIPAWEVTRPSRWIVVPLLLLVQVAILLVVRISVVVILRAAVRVKWLFVVLIVCYLFLPGDPNAADTIHMWQPSGPVRPIPINLTGLETALMMCLQIVTIVMVSAAVRLTGSPTDLVEGLRRFRLPK